MIEHGKVESTVEPHAFEMDDHSVWIAEDIQQVTRDEGTDEEFVGYEYTLSQYSKEEYILHKMTADKLLTDVALAEIAIMVAGGAL